MIDIKVWKYKNKSNKTLLKFIGYTLALLLALISVYIVKHDKKEIEEFRLISIKQKSGKVRYYKQVGTDRINIDKVTLESLMSRYNVVLEEIPNEK